MKCVIAVIGSAVLGLGTLTACGGDNGYGGSSQSNPSTSQAGGAAKLLRTRSVGAASISQAG